MVRHRDGVTTVTVVVVVLSAVAGSDASEVTVAVLTSVPGASGWTTTFTVAVAPLARVPRSKVKVPLTGVTPPVAETNVAPGGGVTTSRTPVAGSGPALATVRVKVRLPPTWTGLGVANWETDRLAVGCAATPDHDAVGEFRRLRGRRRLIVVEQRGRRDDVLPDGHGDRRART